MIKKEKIPKSELSIISDLLIVLIVIFVLTIYYYGLRALVILLISQLTCHFADLLCIKISKKKISAVNFMSTSLTGFIIAMMMPASVIYHFVILTALFSIIIGKHSFGGHGKEIFSSAAAGFLFISLCFPTKILMYPKPFEQLPVSANVSIENLVQSSINQKESVIDIMDILIGKFSGSMGTTFFLLLIIGALILILRRSVSAISFFTQISIISLFSYFYYGGNIYSLVKILSGGMLLFGIIFLSCDFRTIPKTKSSRFLYGVITSVLFLVFFFYSNAENAIVYAVIISAPIGIELDKRALSFAEILNKNNSGLIINIRRRFNKSAIHVNETLQILDRGEESNEKK